ncbi:hypothetical protein [Aquabacter cavernae]|uniref:hypothetical protein n=1 Tax=Aquabacter cavernae TaxID=2496029 RepID=UPI000F8C7228|nr:hypothetical protein [Aquabacter cavernae]
MNRRAHMVGLAALAALTCLPSGPAGAQQPLTPLSHLDQIWPALQACWRAPAGSEGSQITLRFGLNAQGAMKGVPLATYSRLTGDTTAQKAFVAAALTALQRCTPLHMTPELGRVVASRVLTVRFSAALRTRAVDI